MKKYELIILAISITVLSFISPLQVLAIDTAFYSANDILFYNPDDKSCTSVSSSGVQNRDYLGREILTSAQMDAIKTNQPIYEKAASDAGIPWQMIAVIHLRETGLKRVNPSNGQGVYQEVAAAGTGKYPTGPTTDAQFLEQSIWAANFIKGKSSTPSLLASGSAGEIKNTFFKYNGVAQQYITQAKSLGFTEGYDGSPYVMNKADAKRDPVSNPTGWGQIKVDHGGIQYPAGNDYGAYVMYAALAGVSSASCGTAGALSGSAQQKIVQVAEQEFALWNSGQLKPGTDFTKYTYGAKDDWCAWFASWVLKEAGIPVDQSSKPQWPGVQQFLSNGPAKGYVVHPNDGSYKPQPGDLATYNGNSHINIIVGYDGAKIITIGGNEGSGGKGFLNSKVAKSIGYGSQATAYITVK